MEKAVAKRILESALSLGNEINLLDSQITQLSDAEEKKEYVEALGAIMGILTRDFIFRIVREHPELDPDR
jgi:hypothetical protein